MGNLIDTSDIFDSQLAVAKGSTIMIRGVTYTALDNVTIGTLKDIEGSPELFNQYLKPV